MGNLITNANLLVKYNTIQSTLQFNCFGTGQLKIKMIKASKVCDEL